MDMRAGQWRVRLDAAPDAALALRARLFRNGADDRDPFDAEARHLTVDGPGGAVACARVAVQTGTAVLRGYTAQFYDLAPFAAHFPKVLEVGRVGILPEGADPDVPRLLLAALARIVEAEGIAALHGCSSFPSDGAGMARLSGRTAPDAWRPRRRSPDAEPLPDTPGPLPPLLRAWLALGAGVSDHAVRDPDLDTLHVFTALPVAAIPPARAALLTGMLDAV